MSVEGKRILGVVAVLVAMAMVLPVVGPVGAQALPNAHPVQVSKTPLQVNPNLLRPDLAVTLTFDRSVVGNNGILAMHGKVCDQGMRDYVVPPASPVDSEFMVYTRHPPKTYAQESNLVFPGHKSIGNKVAVNGCVTHDVTLTLPGVVRWITQPGTMVYIGPGERLAEKQLVFRLNRKYPENNFFTASEDSSSENNSTHVEIQYVEKAP